jgi:eukaryotic-like serine/threonine-protein kinase
MALQQGERLGPYEIASLLGAGGMGEVYRARDTRLDRDVAIKILPPAIAATPEGLARFEQEAKATCALNHPGILAVFDVGSADGRPYVVAELLEGETLRERLSRGAMPVRKAVECAIQIAQALGAAHEKGIVHRDLKPENLFLTREGRIKVLDFGLARLVDPDAGPDGAETAATMAVRTNPGQVLGSAGYMAPEQVRGEVTDHRGDIFAIGTVFHEMLSGSRAFHGASMVETMHAILREDPPPIPASLPGMSPGLDRVVLRCLEKRPEERFQSARDIAFSLEALSLGPAPAGVTEGGNPEGGGPAGGRAGLPLYHQLTFRRGHVFAARFAPEGQTIIYGAQWDGPPTRIYAGRRDSAESRPLDLPDATILSLSCTGELAISIDYRIVGGFIARGTLARVPLSGGAPRELIEEVQEADWTPDGAQLAVVREVGGRNRLELPAGNVLFETSGWISRPRVSPRGDAVAFLYHPLPADDGGDVMIVDRSGNTRTLSGGWSSAGGLAWRPDGEEVWFSAARTGSAASLHAVSLSGVCRLLGRVTGTLMLHDVSRDGHPLVTHITGRIRTLGLPPGATEERDLSWLDWSRARALSADGTRLLFDETGEGAGTRYGVYLRKTDGSPAIRLGDGTAESLSPDGKWVIAIAREGDHRAMLLPTGAGEARPLDTGAVRPMSAHWFGDGRRVLLCGYEEEHAARVYILDPGRGEPEAITPEGWTFRGDPITADQGTLLARRSDGQFARFPLAGGEPVPVEGMSPEDVPVRWSLSGDALYILWRERLPARLERLDLASGRREMIRELMPPDPAGVVSVLNVLLTPDASSYAYTHARMLSDLFWAEEVG